MPRVSRRRHYNEASFTKCEHAISLECRAESSSLAMRENVEKERGHRSEVGLKARPRGYIDELSRRTTAPCVTLFLIKLSSRLVTKWLSRV